MFALVPPAGTPTSILDLVSLFRARFSIDDQSKELSECIFAFSGARHFYCTNSGRTALAVILRAFAKNANSDKNEVVIPAYTCFSVASAVASSNLKIRLVDIDPATLDYNYDKLQEIATEKVLAIIGCNLFGIPSAWKKLSAFAKARDIKLIDDAAQSMGSVYNGISLGLNGIAGFYSLGRGKNLSTYSGGIIVTGDEEINREIARQMDLIKEPGVIIEATIFIKILLYSLFLNPYLYRLATSIPFLGIGKTVFDMNLNSSRLSKFQICMCAKMLPRLGELNSIRQINAGHLARAIAQSKKLTVIGWHPEFINNYLRLPVLCSDGVSRNKAIEQLRKNGISASAMYPSTIRNITNIEHYLAEPSGRFEGAEQVVNRLLTLPTHPNLKPTDILKMISCLNEL
ncbi:MAG TPA: hypothetical protein DEO84_08275 [candidate division Zixibacteria bacterium]|jgi:perosamine synthetase|nr:hypothetical protein [candidate division Zixibacteria bacterium]HBZ01297.1 hypothetical protein [candidate division Zixibacteria bacterium]